MPTYPLDDSWVQALLPDPDPQPSPVPVTSLKPLSLWDRLQMSRHTLDQTCEHVRAALERNPLVPLVAREAARLLGFTGEGPRIFVDPAGRVVLEVPDQVCTALPVVPPVSEPVVRVADLAPKVRVRAKPSSRSTRVRTKPSSRSTPVLPSLADLRARALSLGVDVTDLGRKKAEILARLDEVGPPPAASTPEVVPARDVLDMPVENIPSVPKRALDRATPKPPPVRAPEPVEYSFLDDLDEDEDEIDLGSLTVEPYDPNAEVEYTSPGGAEGLEMPTFQDPPPQGKMLAWTTFNRAASRVPIEDLLKEEGAVAAEGAPETEPFYE